MVPSHQSQTGSGSPATWGYSGTALVLLGHGSTLNTQSGESVVQHAATLRQRGLFSQVREAFWKQEPRIHNVLAGLGESRVAIVPMFISEGYFSDEIIPKALGFGEPKLDTAQRVKSSSSQSIVYSKPVGTHARVTEILLLRARDIVAQFPFPRAPQPADIWLFIAGHGTQQNSNSRQAIERQVELLRAMNLYAGVDAIYMEEEPRINKFASMATTKSTIVVPFFISDGMHVAEDIPVLLGEQKRLVRQRLENQQPTWRNPTEKKGKLIWYSPSVGTHPLMAEIVLDRAREALA